MLLMKPLSGSSIKCRGKSSIIKTCSFICRYLKIFNLKVEYCHCHQFCAWKCRHLRKYFLDRKLCLKCHHTFYLSIFDSNYHQTHMHGFSHSMQLKSYGCILCAVCWWCWKFTRMQYFHSCLCVWWKFASIYNDWRKMRVEIEWIALFEISIVIY